jgi:hypothetical protein
MRGQPGFFDIDDRLKRLSDLGDQLETFRSAVDFELFRPELNAALSYTDRTEGGRPPFDPVLMFKILVIQATNNLDGSINELFSACRMTLPRAFMSNARLQSHLDKNWGQRHARTGRAAAHERRGGARG